MLKPHQEFYLEACQKLGKTPVPELDDRTDTDKVSSDAYDRLIICIRYINMQDGVIWVPVYNGTEWHYWPVWRPNKSGFGFSFTYCDDWYTHTSVGSRLEYRTEELCEKGAELLLPYYNDYFSPIS
ncbi:hypothetical protein J3L18_00150 [Mucilaginibacter gossypii]|uniref:hypothetical protein n=1 Tax=Mucilaginibacter gossypii TaxID=551996 RepID=UPI000DCB5221|nr:MULTISPECIES: hypothetical protein [Mucilaginibacter]QTE37514.1 hypothetical protein J3L18_00150 [Mucilaginibacter gossypii]RAV52340.1 hypothetical protein DIU36_24710 [Mucilaginibacter rubeus]